MTEELLSLSGRSRAGARRLSVRRRSIRRERARVRRASARRARSAVAGVAALTACASRAGRWAPPEPAALLLAVAPVAGRERADRGGAISPAWAQVAAARLFLGVGAGIANIDVRLRRERLGVSDRLVDRRTRPCGSGRPPSGRPSAGARGADRARARLRAEIGRTSQRAVSHAAAVPMCSPATARRPRPGSPWIRVLRRVRALIDESERRQQRELALRVGEVVRDVNAQRQADLMQNRAQPRRDSEQYGRRDDAAARD